MLLYSNAKGFSRIFKEGKAYRLRMWTWTWLLGKGVGLLDP